MYTGWIWNGAALVTLVLFHSLSPLCDLSFSRRWADCNIIQYVVPGTPEQMVLPVFRGESPILPVYCLQREQPTLPVYWGEGPVLPVYRGEWAANPTCLQGWSASINWRSEQPVLPVCCLQKGAASPTCLQRLAASILSTQMSRQYYLPSEISRQYYLSRWTARHTCLQRWAASITCLKRWAASITCLKRWAAS